MSNETVARGTVRVRSLDTGLEWDEKVHVIEDDIENDWTVEDAARMIVRQQTADDIETLGANLS